MDVHELYESVLSGRLCLDPRRVAHGFALTYRTLRVTVRLDLSDFGFACAEAWFHDTELSVAEALAVTNRVSRRCKAVAAWLDDDGDVCLRVQGFVAPAGTAPSTEILAAVLARMLASLRAAADELREGVTLARLDPDAATARGPVGEQDG